MFVLICYFEVLTLQFSFLKTNLTYIIKQIALKTMIVFQINDHITMVEQLYLLISVINLTLKFKRKNKIVTLLETVVIH